MSEESKRVLEFYERGLHVCHEGPNRFSTNGWGREVLKLSKQLARQVEALEAKYNELIHAVETKHPDETRHETALRYITQAESPSRISEGQIDMSPARPEKNR